MANEFLPSKCCCCSVRAGTIITGVFAMILSLSVMGINSAQGAAYNYCFSGTFYDYCKDVSFKWVTNAFATLAFVGAVETVASAMLIWAACKRNSKFVTIWLVSSLVWFVLHFFMLVTFLFALSGPALIAVFSVVAVVIIALIAMALLTVESFRQELLRSNPNYNAFAATAPTLNV